MEATPGHLQAQRIIVIHPGSLNLRIGRASDLNPITILHAIARRRRQTDSKTYKDTLLPSLHQQSIPDFEEARLHVSHAIQAYVPKHGERGAKRLRVATPPQQIATFNRRSVPEEIQPPTFEREVKTESLASAGEEEKLKEVIFDESILHLRADDGAAYNVHFPMRRGGLNLHAGVGGSMSAVLADMETIWLYALKHRMGISSASLSQYSAALVISDVYNRSHLRELVSLLLQRLHFRSCFLLQDHVAATFGAGLGYACVVDVGDQKCSVSCVEDGISQPDTRVLLSYGGGDVTQVFQTLLRKCGFPYKECDVEKNFADAALLMGLKERFCHITLEVCGAQERTFEVHKPGKHLRYTLQLGDECVVAPLSLFYTELLNITGKQKQACTQLRSSQQPDPEDCFDAEYIRETGRRNGRDQLEGTLPVTGEAADEELVVVDSYDVVECRDFNTKISDKEELLYMPNGQIVPLDHAIVRSIERCASDEMKRKMYGCILLVGSGIKFPGFLKWLEQKVTLQLAASTYHRSVELSDFEVNVFTKEMESGMIAWKGAAIMSCLESAPELWIYGSEWEKYGLRILREKAPFIW